MSFDIGNVGPIQGDALYRALTAASSGATSTADGASAAGADDFAVQVQLASSAEPLGNQVAEAIPVAAQAYDDLATSGHYIHFTLADQPGSLTIELHDQDGTAIGRLDPSDVLRVAAGESVT